MPNPKDTLKDRLARYRQIKISVIGRKLRAHNLDSGLVRVRRKQTLPPASTGFGHAVVQELARAIGMSGFMPEAWSRIPHRSRDRSKAVTSIVEKFREKYGAKDVKKYYSKFDVAVVVRLTWTEANIPPNVDLPLIPT